MLHRVATSSCRGHVDELATEPFLLLHREHGTGYQWSWNCCDRRTCFVVIWKHFCFILSTGTRIRIDSVMRPRSSSRGCNTCASVTVTVTVMLKLFPSVCALQIRGSVFQIVGMHTRKLQLPNRVDRVFYSYGFPYFVHSCIFHSCNLLLHFQRPH